MSDFILENARIFDGVSEVCAEGMSVRVAEGRIMEISQRPLKSAASQRIDVGGRTVMPGLIDLHIHAYTSDLNLTKVEATEVPYRTAHAMRLLGHALDCGFTTVRDVGGGDYSLWRAIEDGLIRGPRLFYVGKILTMTGGHGDMRPAGDPGHSRLCGCSIESLSLIADGVSSCIQAAREQLRRGAHCIKIMGSGGVTSPTDPIWMNQYREDEIRAIVNECHERRSYVTAHCHPASAIRRCVEFGVRCIEHGTLIDADTARFVAQKGAYVVPTIVTISAIIETGKQFGLSADSMTKADEAMRGALVGLDRMRHAGVKLGFGTDLIGSLYTRQTQEFMLRREVFTPIEILRQATSLSAEVLMREGELGVVREGALADLLVVDGDPIENLELLTRNGAALSLIMRNGEVLKNRL